MNCPVDGSELVGQRHGAVESYSCRGCHGVWFTRAQLLAVLRRDRALAAAPRLTLLLPRGSPLLTDRFCPACASQALGQKRVETVAVEVCPKCLGVWFDCDELEQIVRSYQAKSCRGSVAQDLVDPVGDSALELVSDPSILSDLAGVVRDALSWAPEVAGAAGEALVSFVAELFASG